MKHGKYCKRNKTWQVRISYQDQNNEHKVTLKSGFVAQAEVKNSTGDLIIPEPQLFSEYFELSSRYGLPTLVD